MACDVTLSGISYGCDDLGVGGIIALAIANRAEVITAVGGVANIDSSTRIVDNASVTALAAIDIMGVQFNLKDGFSVFSEVKTVNADGTTSTVPTVSVEMPKMNQDRVTALNQLSKAGAELVAFVQTAAGTYHVVGLDYGLYAATVDGNSGTGRAEKNRFQLTLTGEENGLSYQFEETVVDDGGKPSWDAITFNAVL